MIKIEIMDTTLRDGEQTSGVSLLDVEKLNIAKLLINEIQVDRIEVASARVSEGEFSAVKKITEWAAENDALQKIEILGFIDGNISVDWIKAAGAKVINLLCKGSLKHVMCQLKKEPKEHIADIKESIKYATQNGLSVNVYLEDWSNGMRSSKEYVFELLEALKDEKIVHFMMPDTLGILNPDETYTYCKEIAQKFPNLKFDFHGHNDYDMAVANTLSAVKAGFTGVHTTVNGLGERTGNAPLSSVVAVLNDHLKATLSVDESKLHNISRFIEGITGVRIPANKPVIGEHVFTQTCGVHADGDAKGNLYHNDLMPERFGRTRKYALGKTSGKASIKKNLEELGIELDSDSMTKVTQKVIELGDKKEYISTEDLPFIIADVLGTSSLEEKVKIKNYYSCQAQRLKPVATFSIEINGTEYQETATGDGQYDAFMKALQKIYEKLEKKLPLLTDYVVTIPPGGRTDALVETAITWQGEKEFKTRGLDPDQTVAAIKATIKMLNLIENNKINL